MTKTYDNNLQVFEGCKILRQKRNYFKMFKGVKLSTEKFQCESQKLPENCMCWSHGVWILQEGGKKPMVSRSPEIIHMRAHRSTPVWCHPFLSSCLDQVMLQQWLLDSAWPGWTAGLACVPNWAFPRAPAE